MLKYSIKQLMLCVCLIFSIVPTERLMANPSVTDVSDLTLEELMMQELTITSVAKKPQKLSSAASAIYVLKQNDIRRSGATSLPELLRLVPGLQVARITAHKWAVSIRGFNSQNSSKLLVLIDGRSIYSHLNAGVVWDIHNPILEDIERIEVIRGPGASLWGANAMNGVINVITKPASTTQDNLLVAGGGNEEKVIAAFRHGGKVFDKGHYRIYGRYFDRDDGGSFLGAGTDDRADGFQVGFRTDLTLSDSDQLTLQGDYFQGNEKEALEIVTLANRAIDTRAYQYNVLGRWQHTQGPGNEMSLQFYYNREQWNNDISIPVLVNFHIDTFDLDFQHRFQPLPQHEITWGLGHRLIVDDYDSNAFINLDPGSRNIQLYSAFVQDEITLIADFWRLVIGSKFEHNDYTGFEIQPSIRSIWNWSDKHTLWAAISRATRTPSRTERDGTFLHGHLDALVFKHSSAEDLRSEEMIAYEFGYRWQVNKQLNFDLAAYFNDYSRLLDSIIVKGSHVDEKIAYTGEATVWGFELAMDWRPLDVLLIRAHYSYLDDQSSIKLISSNNQTSPHHQVLLLAGVDISSQLQLNLTGRYVGGISDHNIDGYYGFDVHLAWQAVDGLELAIVGRNLLDDQHPEFNERQIETVPTQVKRSIYGKLTWRF